MGFRTRKVLIIFAAIILICSAVFCILNFDAIKKIKWESFDFKIGPAFLKLPVLSSGAGGCGNSIVEEDLGEECDDGNFSAEDGCNSACQWENVSIAYSWCGTTSCMLCLHFPTGRWSCIRLQLKNFRHRTLLPNPLQQCCCHILLPQSLKQGALKKPGLF